MEYKFKCQSGVNDSIGVPNKLDHLFKGDNLYIEFTLAADNTGKLIMPYYFDLNKELQPLNKAYNDKESIDRFLRGNKRFYAKLFDFTMLVSGKLVYKRGTKTLLKNEDMHLYSPVTLSGDELICTQLSTKNGLNKTVIPENAYNLYFGNMIRCVDPDIFTSKNTLLYYLVLGE